MDWLGVVRTVGEAIDVIGVLVIAGGLLLVAARTVPEALRSGTRDDAYRRCRHGFGRAILIGLEILVAADIIRTVALEPTLEQVGVLAAIVLIRTFLSFALELELTGRWPWQGGAEERRRASSAAR